MNGDPASGTSLLGALLVSEGLIAPEQLAACQLLQQYDYPHLRLDQILLRCGYISRDSLEHALQLQCAMHDSLAAALETQVPAPAGLDILVIANRPSALLSTFLSRLGATVRYAHRPPHDLQTRRPDLILVEASKLQCYADLPDACLVELLPDISWHLQVETIPEGLRKLLERYVEQAREAHNRRHQGDEQQHRDFELRALTLLTRGITETTNVQQLLTHLMCLARDLLLVEAATLFRVDARNERLVFEVVLGPNQSSLTQKTIPLNHGIAGWVVQHGEPLIIPDVRKDRRFAGTMDNSTGFQTRSMLCVPMSAFGRIRGVLQLINKQESEFSERDLQVLRVIASFGALALAGQSSLLLRSAAVRDRVMAVSA